MNDAATVRPREISSRTLLIGMLLLLCGFYANLAKDSYMDDYRAFYLASVAVHEGLDPYVNHMDLDERLADPAWHWADSRFLYPPTALLFYTPASRLSYKWSKTAYGTLMALAMVFILVGLSRRFPDQNFLLLALFVSMPMFMNIDNGQIDCAILGLLLGAFYLEDGPLAGLYFGFAIAIKFMPVVAVLWFMGSRRWRTLGWSAVTVTVLCAVAWVRWGSLYFKEFVTHLARHAALSAQVEPVHTFHSIVLGQMYVTTPDGTFAYQHDVFGYLQNPLRFLGRGGEGLGVLLLVGFTGWLFFSERGRRVPKELGFFLFLTVSLLANPLLWAMGLVACFPLIVMLVDRSRTPQRTALMLLVPLFLTKQMVGSFNFTLWLVLAGYCLWESGLLGGGESGVAVVVR